MKFTSGSASREGAGKVLKTISRQLKQRLQIVFASDLSEINVNCCSKCLSETAIKLGNFDAVFQSFNAVRSGAVKIYMHVMIQCS